MAKSDNTVKTLVSKFQKDFGPAVIQVGVLKEKLGMIPTGIFPFDVITYGGFPKGRTTIIYGKEGCGKTNLALKGIANAQTMFPKKFCVFIDLEGTFDVEWASKFSVNTDKLILMRPDYAEQMIDMVEGLMYAEDCSFIALDSLSVVMPLKEVDSSGEMSLMGQQAMVTSKLLRKIGHACTLVERDGGVPPTVVLINQTRANYSRFGRDVVLPGANLQRFAASLIIYLKGKDIVAADYHKTLPVMKQMVIGLDKWKIPVREKTCEFNMMLHPYQGFSVGDVDDRNNAMSYLTDLPLLQSKAVGSGYVLLGQEFKTQLEIKKYWAKDRDFYELCKLKIIEGLTVVE